MKSRHDYVGEQRAARRRYVRAYNSASRAADKDAAYRLLCKLADAHYDACARVARHLRK